MECEPILHGVQTNPGVGRTIAVILVAESGVGVSVCADDRVSYGTLSS